MGNVGGLVDVDEVLFPQAMELHTKYSPSVLFSDGDWQSNSKVRRRRICLFFVPL